MVCGVYIADGNRFEFEHFYYDGPQINKIPFEANLYINIMEIIMNVFIAWIENDFGDVLVSRVKSSENEYNKWELPGIFVEETLDEKSDLLAGLKKEFGILDATILDQSFSSPKKHLGQAVHGKISAWKVSAGNFSEHVLSEHRDFEWVSPKNVLSSKDLKTASVIVVLENSFNIVKIGTILKAGTDVFYANECMKAYGLVKIYELEEEDADSIGLLFLVEGNITNHDRKTLKVFGYDPVNNLLTDIGMSPSKGFCKFVAPSVCLYYFKTS